MATQKSNKHHDPKEGHINPFAGIPRSAKAFPRLMMIYGGFYSEGHVRKILYQTIDKRTGKPYAKGGTEHRVYKTAVRIADDFWNNLEQKEATELTTATVYNQ